MPDEDPPPDLIALGEVFKSALLDKWQLPYFDESGNLRYSTSLYCPWEIEQFCFGDFAFCDSEPFVPWKTDEGEYYSTMPAEFITAMLTANIWGKVMAPHAGYAGGAVLSTGLFSGTVEFGEGGLA